MAACYAFPDQSGICTCWLVQRCAFQHRQEATVWCKVIRHRCHCAPNAQAAHSQQTEGAAVSSIFSLQEQLERSDGQSWHCIPNQGQLSSKPVVWALPLPCLGIQPSKAVQACLTQLSVRCPEPAQKIDCHGRIIERDLCMHVKPCLSVCLCLHCVSVCLCGYMWVFWCTACTMWPQDVCPDEHAVFKLAVDACRVGSWQIASFASIVSMLTVHRWLHNQAAMHRSHHAACCKV